MSVRLLHGDCRRAMRLMAARGIMVDSIVTDPPYHLTSIVKRFGAANAAPAKDRDGLYKRASTGFMGKQWDGGDIAFDPETWALAGAVLKPGGHLLAFGGTRGWHRLACAIEDAGFEIRDGILDLIAADDPVLRFMASLTESQIDAFLRCIEDSQFGGFLAWLFGSGFPKSHDVAKAIDRAAGAEREIVGFDHTCRLGMNRNLNDDNWSKIGQQGSTITAPATPEAAAWDGWGTALKPAFEPIILARKPLSESSVAANVLRHGTGAINVDGCRIGFTSDADRDEATGKNQHGDFGTGPRNNRIYGTDKRPVENYDPSKGRWPANLVHDGSAEVEAAFPQSSGQSGTVSGDEPSECHNGVYSGPRKRQGIKYTPRGDSGTAARFFYSAKAGPDDRFGSKHPTVKPVALMRWLVRLVTPPQGTVLDPFAGSGTTGVACMAEGFHAVLCEREAEYVADIRARLDHYEGKGGHSAAVKHRNRDVDPGPLFSEAAE